MYVVHLKVKSMQTFNKYHLSCRYIMQIYSYILYSDIVLYPPTRGFFLCFVKRLSDFFFSVESLYLYVLCICAHREISFKSQQYGDDEFEPLKPSA